METMLLAAITAGTPAALGEAVAALPFDRVEAYESDGGRLVIGRIGCSVVCATLEATCGCGNPDHENGFKITILATGSADEADAILRRNLDLMISEASMVARVTGRDSVLRPITVANMAAPMA